MQDSLDRRFVIAAASLALVLVTAMVATGQQRQPTSPEMRAKVVAAVDILETDPYHKDAEALRAGVLEWLEQAPDVTVTLCGDMLGDINKLKGYDGSALLGQLAFSEAKFILQNPDKASDAFAVNMAGMDGVLRTYEAMKRAKPKTKFDNLEKILQLRAEHQLEGHVRTALAKCK